MPPENWCGIVAGAALGIRDADSIEEVDCSLVRLALRHLRVCCDGLRDLVADAMHRVEAGKGVLEDHGDVLAPDVSHLVGWKGEQIATREKGLAGDTSTVAVQQAHQRQAGHALTGARFAHDAQGLASVQRVREIGNGPDVACLGGEDDAQAADVEDDLAHA